MKHKYKVVKGVYEGHIFRGYNLDGRIIDCGTIGRSYPEENCIILISDIDNKEQFERHNQTDGFGNCFSDADEGL